MLLRFSRPVRAYVCEQCRTRALLRVQWRGIATEIPRDQFVHNETLVRKRIEELGGAGPLGKFYPRWKESPERKVMDASSFKQQWLSHSSVDTSNGRTIDKEAIVLYGRVKSRRSSGSKLHFIDLESGQGTAQAVINFRELQSLRDGVLPLEEFQKGLKTIRKGDWIAVTGLPYVTDTGHTSILAQNLPLTISVSLPPLPMRIQNKEFMSRNRHVERIIDSAATDVIMLRHYMIRALRQFFDQRDFVEVNTPLLTAGVGGAVARPFETKATELGETKLNLRIAPELFLKRLIIGNMNRVYEIGPAFRNEGVDTNHNPEFMICEFYQVLAALESLINTTEAIFGALKNATDISRSKLSSIPDPAMLGLEQPFRRISFIPTLEAAIRIRLEDWHFPDLGSSTARGHLSDAAEAFGIAMFETSSIPRILDMLCSRIIESGLDEPTWITHHPACMSPLAKSFTTPGTLHLVSARAELFIRGQEYVNCYEEENSPIEQRRKFEEQLEARDPENPAAIDEDYLKALEWGLPPTGGWGCGIDRMVMLFSGKNRIADVLPFGTIANVAAMGNRSR